MEASFSFSISLSCNIADSDHRHEAPAVLWTFPLGYLWLKIHSTPPPPVPTTTVPTGWSQNQFLRQVEFTEMMHGTQHSI